MTVDGQARLVLWDIDYTLIESGGLGREIYERIFPTVVGQPLRGLASRHGRTELDIMHNTLLLHGIAPTEEITDRLAAALAEGYRTASEELTERGRVLPGVWQTLRTLAEDPRTHQSVLTGNTAEMARIKLGAFGLDGYLDLPAGAYGDDHHERSELVAIACERATRHYGTTITPANVLLVGDTPNDVAAARTAGTRVVAVATGAYTVDELRASGAGVVLPNLEGSNDLWSSGDGWFPATRRPEHRQ